MLTKLQNRVENDSKKGEIIIHRYGMWGTNVEIESSSMGIFAVHPNGKKEKFKTLADAEKYLTELVSRGECK